LEDFNFAVVGVVSGEGAGSTPTAWSAFQKDGGSSQQKLKYYSHRTTRRVSSSASRKYVNSTTSSFGVEKTRSLPQKYLAIRLALQHLGLVLAQACAPKFAFQKVEVAVENTRTGKLALHTYRGLLAPSANRASVLSAFLALPNIDAASVQWPDQVVVANLFGNAGARVKLRTMLERACVDMDGTLRQEHLEGTVNRLCANPRPLCMRAQAFPLEPGIGVLTQAVGGKSSKYFSAASLKGGKSRPHALLAAMALGRQPKKRFKVEEISRCPGRVSNLSGLGVVNEETAVGLEDARNSKSPDEKSQRLKKRVGCRTTGGRLLPDTQEYSSSSNSDGDWTEDDE
jgi:hypothetical protein